MTILETKVEDDSKIVSKKRSRSISKEKKGSKNEFASLETCNSLEIISEEIKMSQRIDSIIISNMKRKRSSSKNTRVRRVSGRSENKTRATKGRSPTKIRRNVNPPLDCESKIATSQLNTKLEIELLKINGDIGQVLEISADIRRSIDVEDPEDCLKWTKIKRKNIKQQLINNYIIAMNIKYSLSRKATENLQHTIYDAFYFPTHISSDVIIKNGAISRIKDIEYVKEWKMFYNKKYDNPNWTKLITESNPLEPKMMIYYWEKYVSNMNKSSF